MKPAHHYSNDSAHGPRGNKAGRVPARLRTPATNGKAPVACRLAVISAGVRRSLIIGVTAGIIFLLPLFFFATRMIGRAQLPIDDKGKKILINNLHGQQDEERTKLTGLEEKLTVLKKIDEANKELHPPKRNPVDARKLNARLQAAKALYDKMLELEKQLQEQTRKAGAQNQKRSDLLAMLNQMKLAASLKAAQEELQKQEQRKKELKGKLELEQNKEKQLKALQDELLNLKHDIDSPGNQQKQKLLLKLEETKKQMSAVNAEIEELKQKIIAFGNNPGPVDGTEDDVSLPFLPFKGEVHPLYIECHAAGLTIYRYKFDGGGGILEGNVSLDNIDKNSNKLKAVIASVEEDHKNNGKMAINLLVRPGGIKAYNKVSEIFEEEDSKENKLPYSVVPLPASGKLNFTKDERETALPRRLDNGGITDNLLLAYNLPADQRSAR